MLSRRRFLIDAAGASTLLAGSAALAACGSGRIRAPDSLASTQPSSEPSGSLPTMVSSPSVAALPVRRVSYPVALENRRVGSRDWDCGRSGTPAVEGYLSRASVGPGETFTLQLSASAGPLDVEWYRLGWYGGLGGRLVRRDRGVPSHSAPRPPRREIDGGLIEARWEPALELTIGADWTSGLYLTVIRPAAGDPGYVPFVVRPAQGGALAEGPAPVLFVSAASTWQAYNGWGGKSLYDYNSSGIDSPVGTTRAVEVSFDRPYLLEQGAGLLFFWEIQFVRWLERQRRDVEYIADIDLALHPELLSGRRLLVFEGHHEYWSRTMRDALETAIGAGTNVAFLSANELYQQVRFADSPFGPARRLTCYKVAADDPLSRTEPRLTSCPWRSDPVNEPEATVVGQMYAHVVVRPTDWCVVNAGHWLYAGTGLRDGDRIRNLVGQEYDTFYPQCAPPGTIVLARSPVQPNCVDPRTPPLHTATIYEAPSGATVFAAGTYQWSWALDRFGHSSYAGIRTPLDKRVAIMAANLLNRLGDGPA